MAKFYVQVRNKENTEVISGVTVTAKYKNWWGGEESQEEITNSIGWANFDIAVSHTTIQLEAKSGGSIDKATVVIDFLGNVNPDHITMNLNFKPFESTKDLLGDLYGALKDNAKIATIVISVTAVIVIAVYAKKALSPKIPSIPNIDIKSQSTNV